VFRCRPSPPREAPGRRRRVRSRRLTRKSSRSRHRRAHRVRRVVRSAASGVGNESSDGDGDSPSRRYQYCSHPGNKRRKEHRTARSISGYPEGGHHGCPA
jgi:hypothetical protein